MIWDYSQTNALSDGTNDYLYGNGRIAQVPLTPDTATPEYFLGDALGSVRQLANADGAVTLTKIYDPYGVAVQSVGNGATSYGFTGEMSDSTGLLYLRARYYAADTGRFISRDTWGGDARQPISYNAWLYGYANPINRKDPSGHRPDCGPNDLDCNGMDDDQAIESCVWSPQLSGVEMNMKTYVCRMIAELEYKGYLNDNIDDAAHIKAGRRSPKDAHKYSTAYHILHNFVSIDDLRKTPKDLDGNIWYKEEWDALYCVSVDPYSGLEPGGRGPLLLYVDYLIKKNASDLAEDIQLGGNFRGYIYTLYGRIRDVSYAQEGYIFGDSRRLPNTPLPDVSKHVLGWAVDISEGALHIDGTWKQPVSVIDEISHRYGLKRPYNSQGYIWYLPMADRSTVTQEWWHFEREFGFR